MTLDLNKHPCFNDAVRHQFGRIHLPVAAKCNVQCNFCDRRHDCVNESRPGVTSALLSPGQALHYLHQVARLQRNLAVVGIAGPGDPFANPAETLETLQRVRQDFPDMLLCVASNGLAVESHVEELARLQVSHVTITVNAVDPEIGAQIYSWVRPAKRMLRDREGAAALWDAQASAIRALSDAGITVKINTIIIPGINDQHVEQVAKTVAALGADISNCIGMYSVEGTPFGHVESPSQDDVTAIRREAGKYLPLMHHCTRCRADAVGLLGEAMPREIQMQLQRAAALPLRPQDERPYVAVASREGLLVNQHLGEASELLIFRAAPNGTQRVERRVTPSPGSGQRRWQELAEVLHDCRALLVASAGSAPCQVLQQSGIRLIMMEGLIEEGLRAVNSNQPIRAPLRGEHSCGSGCAGDGTGCG